MPLLDHGTGEYSSLGHMHRGTVRVKTGDRVKQGDLLGQIGSGVMGKPMKISSPKRGIFMEAH